jgi:DNA replication protein DnaC
MSELRPVHAEFEEPESPVTHGSFELERSEKISAILTGKELSIGAKRSKIRHRQEGERSPVMLPPVVASVPREDPCPICKGAGFLRSNVDINHPLFGKAQPCHCTVHAQKHSLFKGANLPPLYAHCTFTTYLTLPLEPHQRDVAALVETFVTLRLQETYRGYKRGLYLYGPWGTGKTGLAIAALQTVVAARQPALYLPTFQLFQILRESIAASQRVREGYADDEDQEDESSGSKLLRLVRTIPWLVLDDLGVECSSPWVISQLYAILETRRLTELFTIFTSNNDMRALQEQWHPESQHRFASAIRIIQRIGEYCTPVYVSGRNLREK